MKPDLVVAGKALSGTSLGGAVAYLVATAPTHVHVYWPYWLFLGGVIVGVVLYFAGQERTRPAKPDADAVGTLAGPAVTDRWQLTIDGVSSEMLQLQNNSMSHPAYMRRSSLESPPPSVRIGIRVACAQLSPDPSTSELRAKFLGYLGQSPVMDLVHELTRVDDGASWTPRNENPPFNFGTVLSVPASAEAPIAWARVLLPDRLTRQYGRDARSAYVVLHVEPRTADGPAPPASLARWYQRLSGMLELPAAFAAFLSDDLSLPTSNDPPAEVGLWLKAPTALTELVEVKGFDVVEGSPRSNWFMSFAIGNPSGNEPSGMALAWLRQLCDSSLHLADYEADLASLGPSATGPRLTTRVVREHWESWNDDTCAATLEVELSNATDDPIRIAEVCLSGLWDPPSAERPTLSHAEHAELDGALMLLDWESSEPLLSSHQSVPPHGSVTGWVFASTPRRPGSTPKVELMVREAVGTTYVTGISPTDPNFSSA